MTLPSKICTPKDFTVKTCFIGNWSVIVAVGFAVDFHNLCLEPISKNSVFAKVSLLAASHTRIPSRSRLIQLFITSKSIFPCGTPQRRNISDNLFQVTNTFGFCSLSKSRTISLWNPEYLKLVISKEE